MGGLGARHSHRDGVISCLWGKGSRQPHQRDSTAQQREQCAECEGDAEAGHMGGSGASKNLGKESEESHCSQADLRPFREGEREERSLRRRV